MKFEVGEFAIVASANAFPEIVGKVICVIGLKEPAPMDKDGRPCPYITDFVAHGMNTLGGDHNLSKLPPREEPAALTRHLEIAA